MVAVFWGIYDRLFFSFKCRCDRGRRGFKQSEQRDRQLRSAGVYFFGIRSAHHSGNICSSAVYCDHPRQYRKEKGQEFCGILPVCILCVYTRTYCYSGTEARSKGRKTGKDHEEHCFRKIVYCLHNVQYGIYFFVGLYVATLGYFLYNKSGPKVSLRIFEPTFTFNGIPTSPVGCQAPS